MQNRPSAWSAKVMVLVILCPAAVALAFVGPLREYAAAFWGAGLVLGAVALATVLRASRPPGAAEHRVGRVGVVAAFTALAVGGYWVVEAVHDDPFAVALPAAVQQDRAVQQEGDATVVPVVHREVDVSDAALAPVVERAAAELEEFVEVEGATRERLVDAVEDAAYVPFSGLAMDYPAATVEVHDGTRYVTVPLLGTDLPEVSKVTFVVGGGVTQVVEMASRMVDPSTVELRMWQDGRQTENVRLSNPEVADGGIAQVGVDWRKLNSCLNSIGINWAVLAVISVACAAACATMVACAPCIAAMAGWTGGSIGACVKRAWV